MRALLVGLLPLLLMSGLLSRSAAATPADSTLQAALEAAVADFEGDVGVYVRHLPSGREAAVQADMVYPTASMIKIPILVGIFDAIEEGTLHYRQPLTYQDSLAYPGDDLTAQLSAGATLSLTQAVMLMITESDNTASLWLQELAGSGTAINAWLADHGFAATRVNSRTAGRQSDWAQYGWGQTTPREMARLLTLIAQGEAVSRAASVEMQRVLTRSRWSGEGLSQLPPSVAVLSKQGAVRQSRSEVLLVHAPSGPYVVCAITNNQTDERYAYDNEGYVLLRQLSRLVWTHFEPDNPWAPPEGADRYYREAPGPP